MSNSGHNSPRDRGGQSVDLGTDHNAAAAIIAAERRPLAGHAMRAMAPFFGLLLVALIFYAIPPHRPIRMIDAQTIAVQTVIVGIAALGMTLLIISGGIDLSVGSAVALCGVTTALVLKSGHSLWLAIPAGLLTGVICGVYNGLLVVLLRLPPFIATLGTMGFYRGVAKWASGSIPINAPTRGMSAWVQQVPGPEWLLFAPSFWLLLALSVLMAALLRRTVLGRYTFAIGSNEATARLCGIRVDRTKVLLYALAGGLIGLSGLLQFARQSQGDPTTAVGLELDVIAAVVIGGASLAGGQGSVAGTLAGALLMAFLKNRCTGLGWQNYVQEMIVGHIIIIAVAVDQWRARRQSR